MQFAISVHHHLEILLRPTLIRFFQELEGYTSVRASEYYLDGKIPTIGDLLDQAEDSLLALENS